MLLDLKRSNWLPPYDDEGVRIILNEMDNQAGEIERMHQELENGGMKLHNVPPFSECNVLFTKVLPNGLSI